MDVMRQEPLMVVLMPGGPEAVGIGVEATMGVDAAESGPWSDPPECLPPQAVISRRARQETKSSASLATPTPFILTRLMSPA